MLIGLPEQIGFTFILGSGCRLEHRDVNRWMQVQNQSGRSHEGRAVCWYLCPIEGPVLGVGVLWFAEVLGVVKRPALLIAWYLIWMLKDTLIRSLYPKQWLSFKGSRIRSHSNRPMQVHKMIMQQFLQRKHINKILWSAINQDLNPMEPIWDELCRRVQNIATNQELWKPSPPLPHVRMEMTTRKCMFSLFDLYCLSDVIQNLIKRLTSVKSLTFR